jgi:hypothetical protein
MTMHTTSHPDDERLAALAGADRDARADRALAAHVTACDRCGPLVADLSSLQLALSSLPDVVPSRPLRLLPPMAEPAPRRGMLAGWLRWVTTPAMAAGALLVLVGAMGSSGALRTFAPVLDATFASQRAAETWFSSAEVGAPGAQSGDSSLGGIAASAPPSAAPTTDRNSENSSGGTPWLPLIAVGVALVSGAALLRYAVVPRAG